VKYYYIVTMNSEKYFIRAGKHNHMNQIQKLYALLKKKYGSQGWWPIAGKYHKGDYRTPRNPEEQFEICIGAILAQAVAWKSVEKALENIRDIGVKSPSQLLRLKVAYLEKAIKPAGYFRQKARKLREFAKFYEGLNGRMPARDDLLSVWGIGEETADSMLLYAYKVPTFVVDAYTHRILLANKIITGNESYSQIKALFEKNLPEDLATYQEYHALLVEHGKNIS
jgi:endonuclease III related protein